MATAHVLQQTEWNCYCRCRHKLEKPDCRQQDENHACRTFRNVDKVVLCISDNFGTFCLFHVTLLFPLFIFEEHNFRTSTFGSPLMYVHFHTLKDFGTTEVYQVTKDDENMKCWKVSLAEVEVCQQLRWYISAMQAMSDDGEKIEIDWQSMYFKQIGAT